MLNTRHFLAASALLGALALAGATALSAHEFKAGDLQIAHPWTRATPKGASTAAGYLKITNNGKEADTLVAASSEAADKVEIHEMTMENDVMKMRQLKDGFEIKPGETVELKPGASHLMIVGVKTPFKEGTMIKGTLTFAKAGTVPVEFKVEAIGGTPGTATTAHQHSGH
jgi:periplasmic copper chaperone A